MLFSDLSFYHVAPQGRHSRRPGEEESDVDIEGFEEDDDGKPKTPAPVRKTHLFIKKAVELHIYDLFVHVVSLGGGCRRRSGGRR